MLSLFGVGVIGRLRMREICYSLYSQIKLQITENTQTVALANWKKNDWSMAVVWVKRFCDFFMYVLNVYFPLLRKFSLKNRCWADQKKIITTAAAGALLAFKLYMVIQKQPVFNGQWVSAQFNRLNWARVTLSEPYCIF